MSSAPNPAVPPRLTEHLAQWLGAWPAVKPLQVIGTSQRLEPGAARVCCMIR